MVEHHTAVEAEDRLTPKTPLDNNDTRQRRDLKWWSNFQRPWGVTPSKRSLPELEKLQQFYAKVIPDQVNTSAKVLLQWKVKEQELYGVLRSK